MVSLSDMTHDELVAEADTLLAIINDPNADELARNAARLTYENVNVAARALNQVDKRVVVGQMNVGGQALPQAMVDALNRERVQEVLAAADEILAADEG